jgi:hypothetical protein
MSENLDDRKEDSMQKIKVFIASLTILVLAATFLGSVAMAAQVVRVNESSGRVYINGGANDGYLLGTTVCFHISTRDMVICGAVESASGSEAVVKVEKRWGKKILKGTEAILPEDEKEMKEKEDLPDKEKMKEKGDGEDIENMPENEDWFQ